MGRDLLNDIEQMLPHLSKGQKSIARYIGEHYDKAAYMTASKLGATVGVSESTVVRFAIELGYEGYPQLQKELQDIIRNKLTSVQRIDVTLDRMGEGNVLDKVLGSDIEKLRRTLSEVSRENFNGAVEAIANASTVYILGVRSSSALSEFLSYYLNLILKNVKHVYTTGVSEMMEQMLRINAGDVVIGISFPRYSSKTVEALKFAVERGAEVVAITDSPHSPLVPFARYSLFAKSDMASFVDSLVAPLSLINALIVAIGNRKRDEVYKTFTELESIWSEFEVYEQSGEERDG